MEKLPYRAILFDGAWGIGKSYAINEGLERYDNVCKISMFGLNDAKQIYHEALLQLAIKNNVGGKVGEIANNILEGLSKVWGKAAQAKEVIYSIVKEREFFLLLSKEFKSLHVIVIDDLERIGDNISLEEVLGIVEELKQCNYIKIILVAHLGEITDKNKEVFDKYNEKVIDRIYHVTERPEKVDWKILGVDAGFITEFLSVHNAKNLRTLEKAQRFYDDVKLYCNDITNELFLNEIRLISFAIVVESIDNLYYRKEDETEKDEIKKNSLCISNELEHRIRNYLGGNKSSANMVSMLLKYYSNQEFINMDSINAEYMIFLEAGEKPNYYKTDEEIKRILPSLSDKIDKAQNLAELNKFADEYMVWSDIVKVDNLSVLQKYREKLVAILKELISDGKEETLDYDNDIFHLSSEKVKRVYSEENTNMKKYVIGRYIDYLKENTKGKQAYEYSYKLKNNFYNFYYRDIIKELAGLLYNKKSFPINNVENEQYRTCFNIMYVLYHINSERFLGYCDELLKECDNMSANRIDNLIKQFVKR